ncbi:ammonium transporter [Cytophagales bacterium LB-30]|uniref:Ammonium transporter n=1 Tax=Shiella aurantiaca TaxID=3058365 RepID=A0ABT8F399_9BACT|nr:ammonium transporter [Shiella aurantiaca]MDN4164938.1 ammonium transporter [Shiella aurantiaca]
MSVINRKWLLPFALLMGISILGAFWPKHIPSENLQGLDTGDTAWLLTAAGLVLLMTPGLSFFYAGMVRYKNLVSTMLQSFIALGIISILWVLLGFSLAFGESIGGEGMGIIGNPLTYFMFDGVGISPNPDFAATIPFVLFALFQLKFAIITPALITGAFAERVRFSAFMLFICLFSLLIYSPLAHMTWHPNGLLRNWGVLDFAGGTVVHISAGFAALAGALFLGKRSQAEAHEPSYIPYVLLGTGMLWFGWFGFNGGSALGANGLAAMSFLTTNTASAAAMLAWILFDGIRGRKPSAMGACIGAVVGLVAITPAAGFVNVGQSILIGSVASIISNWAVHLKSKTSIDDTLDVFPCHGVGGISGMIFTGIFAHEVGLVYGDSTTFLYHLLALVLVSIFTFGGSYFLYWLTDKIIPLRVSQEHEELGLDLSQHGEKASPYKASVLVS